METLSKHIGRGALAIMLLLAPWGCSKQEPEPTGDTPEVPAAAAKGSEEAPFTVSQETSGHYAPGAPLAVKTTMNYTGTEPVTALALQVALPQAWRYGGIGGELKPAIDPPAGTTGQLTLIWIQIPKFPAAVEFTLDVPDWAEGTYTLSAQAIYRTLGGELKSPANDVPISHSK